MDFGASTRATAVGAYHVTARSDAAATRGSIPVELPTAQTVQSAAAGEAVQLDLQARSEQARRDDAAAKQNAVSDRQAARQRERNLRDLIERRIVIEPRTREVVIQKKNRVTGETVSQLPDETLLRLRIYSRELAEKARLADETSAHHYIERTA
ncbi:hypothetical protein FG93_04105 [Bosea sp. LC85]|uniref:hypothetical protein n=1 Tax=Bosea sp. LC85 TaxID=1502851 RepID=UPI0004E2ED3E|nr:hypothetical protein [Bosea sp. LC85]KFC67130.1 hypothetical protein FG93_04105 [Bosea sp. LC85]